MFKCKGIGCAKIFSSKIGRSLHHNKCEFYEKPIEKIINYVCECGKGFNTKGQLKGHRAKCVIHLNEIKKYKETITFNLLYELYVKNGMSALQISKKLNYPCIGPGQIIQIIKDVGITPRTHKQAANEKSARDLYKSTCLSKYGDINVLGKKSKLYEVKNKTVCDKYGVGNVFQSDQIKKKIKNTLIERYGVDNPIKIPGRQFNNGRKSKIHIKVEQLLDELGIKYESENTKNLFEKDGYSPRPDIIIHDLHTVIEINGDYWHGNPLKYKENDIIYKWGGPVFVKDVWIHDKKRLSQIESFGYRVIVLWEDYINKELDKNKLWNLLGLNQ
jgi:G:T-mismatch repair DNA endonuclease (very short patch repair protein)